MLQDHFILSTGQSILTDDSAYKYNILTLIRYFRAVQHCEHAGFSSYF